MAWLERLIPFIVIGACVLVIFAGRRKGLDRHASNMAAARAEGAAELRAELGQTVTVVAGNTYTGDSAQPVSGSEFARYDRAVLPTDRHGLSAADRLAIASMGDPVALAEWYVRDEHGDDDDNDNDDDRAPVARRSGSVDTYLAGLSHAHGRGPDPVDFRPDPPSLTDLDQ